MLDVAARALAEPRRRAILCLVRDNERTVSEIAEHFEVSRPAISQHLRVLADANLVSVRAQGTRRYYRTRPEGLADLHSWIEGFWTSSLSRLVTQSELEHSNTDQSKPINKG